VKIELITFHIFLGPIAYLRNTKHLFEFQERRRKSPSTQPTSEQLREIIEEVKKTDQGAREVQEHVGHSEEVLNPDNTRSVVSTVLNTINNKFEHECLDEAVRLLNIYSIRQSSDDRVPGYKYSIPGLPGTKFVTHQVWGIWLVLRRWMWDADIPGALVADEMGLGKTFTSAAAATLCKLVSETFVMGLPLSDLWGNTLKQLVILPDNDFPGIVGEGRESYLLQRLNSLTRCQLKI